MLQFISLFNHLDTAGAEEFAKFLNTASSSEASQAGTWLRSASDADVVQAATLLNGRRLEEFKNAVGIRPGLWSRLFGGKKSAPASTSPAPPPIREELDSPPAPVKPPKPVPKPAPKPDADESSTKTECPHCGHRVRYAIQHLGRKTKCPHCSVLFRLPPARNAPATALDPVAPKVKLPAESDWRDLTEYLRTGQPGDFSAVSNADLFANILRYYEHIVADPSTPNLRYFVLKAKAASASHPYLILETGVQADHDASYHFNYKPILERALPGQGWNAISRDGYANHSKPGCSLASTAPFQRLADAVLRGDYTLERVLDRNRS